ncbi:MAG: hypothetical protein JXJ17_00760 [Anaerolineae bacterium]|nr:hypothetical protein [Anaerolineae bacterium]
MAQEVDEVETTYVLDIGTPLTMVLAETTDGEDRITPSGSYGAISPRIGGDQGWRGFT